MRINKKESVILNEKRDYKFIKKYLMNDCYNPIHYLKLLY